jgi:hypothetical protein
MKDNLKVWVDALWVIQQLMDYGSMDNAKYSIEELKQSIEQEYQKELQNASLKI